MTNRANSEQYPIQEGEPRIQARVLAAEDEMPLRVLAKRLFGTTGGGMGLFDSYEVFEDGQKALAAFERNPDAFDVLMTDYNMPGMNGAELAAEIKSRKPNMVTVLVSSKTLETLKPHEVIHFDLNMEKPFSAEAAAIVAEKVKARLLGQNQAA